MALGDRLLDAFDAVRDFASGLAHDFRESNRAFKVKTVLIGSYLAVGVATVVIFIPPGELNEIGAEVRIAKTIVEGKYFLVKNLGSDEWKDISLTMNGTYTYRWPKLRAGKKRGFHFNKFADANGRAPHQDIRVQRLRIDCSRGSFERDFEKMH